MGAKPWMLAYVDGKASEILKSNPELDRVAASELAGRFFPSEKLEAIDDGDILAGRNRFLWSVTKATAPDTFVPFVIFW